MNDPIPVYPPTDIDYATDWYMIDVDGVPADMRTLPGHDPNARGD